MVYVIQSFRFLFVCSNLIIYVKYINNPNFKISGTDNTSETTLGLTNGNISGNSRETILKR